MKAPLLCAAVLLTCLTVTARLYAHHAFAAEFDAAKPVTLKGTVTKIAWTNPHAHIHLDVSNSAGGTVSWDLELGSPNALMRRGWSRQTLKPGDVVTASGYLAKDGSNLANARAITLDDGRSLFAGSSNESGNGP
jgi:hypothetical protein